MPATSEKQKRFMQAVANNPEFAKQVGVPQSVGKEFTMKKYQNGKAVKKKEEKLSPGDAADRAAMKDFGNQSFLRPPKEGPKAGTYKGSTKKKDEGKVIRNAKPRSALDRFVGKPTSKEEQELEDLHRSYSSKGRNRKSATQKFIDSANKGGGAVKKYAGGGKSGSKFPDLTGDGKVTQADVLKGRGVGKAKGKKVSLPKGMHRMPDGSVMKDSEHKKMGGGSMKYAGGGKVRGYGMARGGRACKIV